MHFAVTSTGRQQRASEMFPCEAHNIRRGFPQALKSADSLVVRIPAFQAGDPGSNPGRRTFSSIATAKVIPVGLEPTIFGSEDRRLIH